uniref:Uncharacterized protein n=1 Tax=Romanomermis culicivorax TaxID=13658 RepID=A0A915IH09_ROMCU
MTDGIVSANLTLSNFNCVSNNRQMPGRRYYPIFNSNSCFTPLINSQLATTANMRIDQEESIRIFVDNMADDKLVSH